MARPIPRPEPVIRATRILEFHRENEDRVNQGGGKLGGSEFRLQSADCQA